MKFIRLSFCLLLTSLGGFAASGQPSVLVSGGSMMNGDQFADSAPAVCGRW